MHFHSVLVFCFASAVLADHSSKRGQSQLFNRSEGPPSAVAGATFTDHLGFAITTVATQFYVPKIQKDLHTPSSVALGAMLDGLHGCVGMFAGVHIYVDQGEALYFAVFRNASSVNYEVYPEFAVQPGEWVTISINFYHGRQGLRVTFQNGTEPQKSVTIDLGTPLCARYASWVVEKLPNLPLTKFDTVDLIVIAGIGQDPFNTEDLKVFSSHGATASIIAHGGGVDITVK